MEQTTPATTTSTALTNAETQRALQHARSQVAGPRLPQIATIRMKNDKSDVKEFEKGEYFIERSQKNEESGETEKVRKSIGMNPEVSIIRRLYSYSFYSEAEERLMAWTNEFEGFTFNDIVYLINNEKTPTRLEFHAPYQEFKAYAQEHYKDRSGKNLLKFKNVFYVWYEGELFRMFISNASITGIPAEEKHGDYKNPQPGCFLNFEKTLLDEQGLQRAYFEAKCRFGSKQKDGDSFYIMTFENAGPPENIAGLVAVWQQFERDNKLRFVAEFGPFISQSPTTQPIVPGVPEIQYKSDVSVEDLPW